MDALPGGCMEWVLENPVGMLCMQEYMIDWEENMNQAGLCMVQMEVDYCAWSHWYKKPTHLWTSMVYWKPKGDQAQGTGRCRGQCSAGSRGESDRWGHTFKLGQNSQAMKGERGRKVRKAAVPVGLHKEIINCRRGRYQRLKTHGGQ